MNEIITIEPILLIGIEEKTKNLDEINGNGKIYQAIHTFYSKIFATIPNKIDNQVLALYTDYETDENGYYTYFIGAKVEKFDILPPETTTKTIPSARYKKISSAKGNIQEIVINEWIKIWKDSELKNERAYTIDFELYDERCVDSENAQVDIYIAIK